RGPGDVPPPRRPPAGRAGRRESVERVAPPLAAAPSARFLNGRGHPILHDYVGTRRPGATYLRSTRRSLRGAAFGTPSSWTPARTFLRDRRRCRRSASTS